MRINKMVTQEKRPWSYIKFSQLILKGNVWRSVWRICMLILGLKGLIYKGHSCQSVTNLYLTYFLVSVIVYTTKKLLQGSTLMIEHEESAVLHLFM